MAPSKMAPATLADGEVRLGTSERIGKMNFYSVTLYSAALYADVDKAKELLKGYAEKPVDDLLADSDFLKALMDAPLKKVLRITMCRSLDKRKIADIFEQPLMARLGEDAVEKVKEFIGKITPDSGFANDDVLTLVFHADSKTINVDFTSAKAKEEPPQQLVEMDDADIWKAFLDISYFGADTEVLSKKQGVLSELPASAPAPPQEPHEQENASEAGSIGQRRRRTWKERAHRTDGGDGYSFGDVTKALYYKLAGTPACDYTNEICSEGDYPEGHWKERHDEMEVALATASAQLANAERSATLRLSLGVVFTVLMCLLSGQFLEKEVATQAQVGVLVVFVLNSIRVAVKPNALTNAKKDS